jgi:radical SAM protein with 4Fe4S-binding SPASM domain
MENKYFEDLDNFMSNVEYPYIYQIEVTERCNLQCPMCLNKEMTNKQDLKMDLLDIIIENDYLRDTPYTELQMSGEPILHPNLLEIIYKIRSTGTMVGMSSNLAKKIDSKLLKTYNSLDSLTISFDVFDKELYEVSRYPNKWESFLSNFEFLMEHVSPNVLVFVQLLYSDWTKEKFKESKDKLYDFLIKNDFLKDNIIIRYVDDCFIEQREDSSSFYVGKKGFCINPFLSVSIKADGIVVPCCFDFKKELPLGNLYNTKLEDIWNGDKMQLLRDQHLGKEFLPEKCRKCYYRSPIRLIYSFLSDLIKFKNTGSL